MMPGFRAARTALDSRSPILEISAYSDRGYLEIVQAYLTEIGIAAKIEALDQATWRVINGDRTWDGLNFTAMGLDYPPAGMCFQPSTATWTSGAKGPDPVQEEIALAVQAATTLEEEARLVKECDMHMIKKHADIWGPKVPQFTAVQPWVIGYNGEVEVNNQDRTSIFARLWIDQELKKSMGR